MGSLYKNGRVRGYILIFLIIVSFVLSVPVKKAFNNLVNKKITEFTQQVYALTGFSLTYKSLSPSILSNIYIKDILLSNDEGEQLLFISKTRVNFKLFKILKGNLQQGISSVVIDGINLNVTQTVELYKKYKDRFKTVHIDFATVKQLIPENIKLKNINFEYEDEKASASLALKSVSVDNSLKKQVLNFQLDSIAKAELYSLKKRLSCRFEAGGTISQQIDNSFLNIKLSDLTDGVYRLNKLNLHAAYSNNKIQLHTIQAVNPVSLGVDYNIKTGDVNAQLRSQEFSPIALITMTSKQKELRKLKDLLIDTDTILKSNIKEKTFDYISDTSVLVPDSVFPGGFKLAFSVFGDENKIDLSQFDVNGPNCNVNARLEYLFKTMQLNGSVEVPKFMLANGKTVSTEVYFDPKQKGFMAFSPQLFVGERALTALQLDFMPSADSYDFVFDVYDYSNLDKAPAGTEPGNIRIEGSFLNKSNYLQTNIQLNSIYLESIAAMASQVTDESTGAKLSKIQPMVSSFMLSGDLYASTDFKSLAYNVPYILLANTKKDNQALMLTLNGTEQNLQVNQLSMVLGQYAMQASASLDKNPDTSDMFFTLDMNSDSVPYHFSGTLMPEVCNITGDYGTDIEFHFDESKNAYGHVLFKSFPISYSGQSVIFTSDAEFKYSADDGPSVQVNHFEAEGADGKLSVNPRIAFSGNISRYGARFNSITYTDLYSALEGTSDVMLNINENIFDSINLMLNVKNPISKESVVMDCNISNPEHLNFTKENLLNSIYMNLQIQANDFSLNRFAMQKNENNIVSGSINASGTLLHPYVAVSVDELSMIFASELLKLRGNVIVEDRDVTMNDIDLSYSIWTVSDINAQASLDNMSLNATGDLRCDVLGKTVIAPLVLTAGNAIIPEGKMLPDSLSATLSTDCVSGTIIKKEFPLSLSAIYSDKKITFYSSQFSGINGSYALDGLLQLSVDNGDSVYLNVDGIANAKTANLDIYDVNADLKKVFEYIDLDEYVQVQKGNLNGELVITGSFSDPDMNGFFLVSGAEALVPAVTSQKVTARDTEISIVNSEIALTDVDLTVKSGQKIRSSLKFFMNKWKLDHMEGSLNTLGKELFPGKLVLGSTKLTGDVSFDLALYYEKPVMEITGKVFGENVSLATNISGITSKNQMEDNNKMLVQTDLDIKLGTHASINFDPLLRCVFMPNTAIKLKIDQTNETYYVDGVLKLRSGDIAYLNRSFYIKSGTIVFNPDDVTNPLITVTAETRERDDAGQNVKISMSIEKQYLMNLSPQFSSNPPKSENEIRLLLGQIAVADANSAANFIVAASDYAIQSVVIRRAENKLREMCNFDIFSVRTNVLQNTVNMGVSGDFSRENLSIGNFLDNTTVYIGKYLGSSLYLDAMLHVSFENGAVNDITSARGVVFHPEIGMELESPFANIRVNMAPDINALLNNQFVPSTSVTLSWKYTF